jgi:quercetin dioxygenase-like cupin family protein
MKRKQWLAMALPATSVLSAMALGAKSTAALAENSASKPRAEKQKVRGDKMFTIETCIREFSEAAAEKTTQGWQFWSVATDLSPTFNLKMTQVGPQSANHPPHAHPEEEIYYVLEGKAEFSLDGKSKTVGPNSTMFCPSRMPHGIRNVGDAPLRYAVIKANYPRTQ